MVQISMKVPLYQLHEIDKKAKRYGLNRSEYMRFVSMNANITIIGLVRYAPEIKSDLNSDNKPFGRKEVQEGGAKEVKNKSVSKEQRDVVSLAPSFKLRGHKLVKKKDVFGDYNEWKEV